MKTAADLERAAVAAEARIRSRVRETRVEPSPLLGEATGAEVFLKLENLQETGSFKARGALNKVLAQGEPSRARGVVAASTGNHGAAVAWACGVAGARARVFVPENAAATKLAAIERLGAEVRFAGADCVEAERAARSFAEEHGMTYVSPYNDPEVIAGQGTIAIELVRQLEAIDVVFGSLGGGGMLAGIAGVLAVRSPSTRVIGVSPENSMVMIESVRAGEILDLSSKPTLSDGSAGGVEAGAITFPLVRDWVHDFVSVTEEEIAAWLRRFIDAHHMLIEGAAASVLAGMVRRKDELAGKRVVAILCGGNIGSETLAGVLS